MLFFICKLTFEMDQCPAERRTTEETGTMIKFETETKPPPMTTTIFFEESTTIPLDTSSPADETSEFWGESSTMEDKVCFS